MENETFQVWSLAAYWVQAIATFAGLAFIWRQIQLSRKTSDFQNLMSFLKEIKDYEDSLISASDGDCKEKAFNELLDFLECYAAAINDRLVHGTTKKIVVLKLRDSLSAIQVNSQWHDKLEAAISSPETFEELSKFAKKHKKSIGLVSKVM